MDLTTNYMGLCLKNPLIASPSPLNGELETLRALEDHGAGAVVLPSIFEEQVVAERREFELRTELPASGFAEAQTYFPTYNGYGFGPERYLDVVRRAKEAIGIPVIASLNGVSDIGWVDYSRGLQQAGADAIELNIYLIPADLTVSGREVEQHYLNVLAAVKAAVSIPVAVKIGPYFSAVGTMARTLANNGADALVLFNRFYQPDINIATLELSMDLDLSTPAEVRLPLLWIAILYGRTTASLAATTGVESADDVFKYLLAGADTVMTTSSLLRHGVAHMRTLVDELSKLLAAREIDSLDKIRGRMSQRNQKDPTAFERANYVHILQGYHIAPSP
ncbi:MAG TPA: dihydroorotate dehydrogenase-like protein [Aurantimonas coralicida]|uniref:Dihydroorotate dehydrogenase-like protein n=2 Tax=root TaxID=1 RepID=A0A9C9NH72_9HYPH|nr:dihydroorotate dehydrogenase-like protein [Aurantimonas coralicida]HEU01641.1 dihydroorotate dehydrogenase-like protein [Aurantimonas coralicida]